MLQFEHTVQYNVVTPETFLIIGCKDKDLDEIIAFCTRRYNKQEPLDTQGFCDVANWDCCAYWLSEEAKLAFLKQVVTAYTMLRSAEQSLGSRPYKL